MNTISRAWHLTESVEKLKVQLCDKDISRAEAAAHFVQEGLLNGEAVIVLARRALRQMVISRIESLGLDVQAMKGTGQIRFVDAQLLLACLQVNDVLEEYSFQEHIVTTLQSAQSKFGKVRIFCGMIDTVWKEPQSTTAIQLESLWVRLAQIHEFSLLCSYSLDGLDSAVFEASWEQFCERHAHLGSCIPSEIAAGTAAHEILESTWNRITEKLAVSSQLPGETTQPASLN